MPRLYEAGENQAKRIANIFSSHANTGMTGKTINETLSAMGFS